VGKLESFAFSRREREHGPSAAALTEYSPPPRVLIVDTDTAFRDMVATYLGQHDMRVALASSRQAMASQLAVDPPSLVLLDLGFGQENGLDLLRQIRSRSDVMVITTGHECSEIDRVVGLELGADDHIGKPLGVRELLARIRSVLRRQGRRRTRPQRRREQNCYRFGAWQLNRHAHLLTDANGERVPLTRGEYSLLITFLDAPKRPLARAYLLQATHIGENAGYRTIDVQVLRLRRKLETVPNAPSIIRAQRGVGYIFDLPVERLPV
jgi:two-component system, OmpR family, response regulator